MTALAVLAFIVAPTLAIAATWLSTLIWPQPIGRRWGRG